MRIATATIANLNLQQLRQLEQRQLAQQTQLTSGQRFQKVSDDASAATRVLENQNAQRSLIQSRSNASEALTVSQISQDTVGLMKDYLEQGQNFLETARLPDEGPALAKRVDGLLADFLNAANTRHNDEFLFAGTDTGNTPFVAESDPDTGAITGFAYNGTDAGREISVAQDTTLSPFADGETNASIAEGLNSLLELRDSLQAGDTALVSAATGRLETAADGLLNAQSSLSFTAWRIETLQQRDASTYERLDVEIESTRSADLAESTMNLLSTQNAYQAALQTTSRILDLNLLRFL
jgi:flagellar hook-associated protein 3 FlgL